MTRESRINELIDTLNTDSWDAYQAGEALAEIGDPRGFKAVLERRPSLPAAVTVAKVLAGLDPFSLAVESISRLEAETGELPNAVEVWLPGKVYSRVVQTTKELEETIAKEVVEPLIGALNADLPAVRAMAALALGGAKNDPRVVEALRLALDDTTALYLDATCVAIPILGIPQSSYSVAEVAGLSLIRLGDRDSARRIARLAIEKWDYGEGSGEKKKEHFFRYMFKCGWDTVVAELGLMSRHKKRSCRRRAVSCLAAIAGPQVVQPLVGFLKDKDTTVRKRAVEALGQVGDSGALQALSQATADKKWTVRRAAKKAIARIEGSLP